jgi:hypothetical protein
VSKGLPAACAVFEVFIGVVMEALSDVLMDVEETGRDVEPDTVCARNARPYGVG